MVDSKRSTSFYEQVRLALNNFQDPLWLGEYSPLAAPYFLGAALKQSPAGDTPQGRGEVLRLQLQSATETLWPGSLPVDKDALVAAVDEERQQYGNKGAMYHYLLLELRYFRRYFYPRSHPRAEREVELRDYLGVGRGPYFNHLKAARQSLGDALLSLLRPSFRLEQPVLRSEALIAREHLIQQCVVDLKAGKTVAINGMGGVGKTSLGAAVAEQWSAQPVFWFTFRPTFNDQLSSLLFSLGNYLHLRGASGLWLQLVADKGKVENYDLALALLRGDLHALPQAPLLCFDETDHLQEDPEKPGSGQIQIREFLNGLHGLVSTLFIGQQDLLTADVHHNLEGLTLQQVVTFLTEAQVPFAPADVPHLHAYTGGNPRLLKLCAALLEEGRALSEIITETPGVPALQALLERLWRRLGADARQMLLRLAVFRSPAPDDAWPDPELALKRLVEQHIVQRDGYGGVSLLPIIRDLLYDDRQRFPAELHEQYHLEAAGIRAARGEYTAAAWHYSQGGEAALAVQVWFPHRNSEVMHGQAAAALAIFQQMSVRRLGEAESRALALLRAELYELTGEVEKGLTELEATEWSADSMVTADALLLRGHFLNALGRAPDALQTYEEGMSALVHLLRQLARFRYQGSITHVQQRQMKEAWKEARLAQYEAEHLQGLVQDEQGQFDEAYLYYQRALALARSVKHEPGIAKSSRELAVLLSRQAKLEEARNYAEEASAYYEHTGDRFGLETMHNVLAAIYFQAGQYEKAIEIAEIALLFFEEARMPYWASTTGATLAEAYFEVENLDKAEEIALKVLRIEEPHSHPYALFTIGRVRQARQDLELAERYFQQSLDIAQQNGDKFMEAYAWQALGKIYREQGQEEASQNALMEALGQFEALEIAPEIEATRHLLVDD
ncbi:MAG: tetratricopeptide repeat protein [Chloroflexota bacterium]|nr:MAG: tetratricopeptide repeat protein [Chloroflexota bacterium]